MQPLNIEIYFFEESMHVARFLCSATFSCLFYTSYLLPSKMATSFHACTKYDLIQLIEVEIQI